ncbi:unnamed protein product (macronuclear) [Paramecium tetraurelia]|uniref:Transmembrane protein n=1 Tax=Paramecium tetraurelia TaxID=5888 RepID=A0D9M3_PARTE|nr:uncharacterized protein GSPATT00014670001 [Paramecium tetraurelia]CAK79740.1 unnamed protein product [Paramecium tetraurelia]|eukprot:XP_001447137.1 hypothetical protein (macronuclear) [Paramecium tetraurelia strain d4-2]
MISQKQETISFNIVNFPLSKELLLGVGAKSNFICDKLNIPLLSQKQQVDKSQRANFKLFTDVNQSYRMLGKHHHTQRLKIQTSLCVNDQMENKEIWRDKDMSTKRRLSQQNQAQRISLEGSTSKIKNVLKDRMSYLPFDQSYQQDLQIKENREYENRRVKSQFVVKKSDHIIIPRIKLFNNTLIVRNEKNQSISNQIYNKQEIINKLNIQRIQVKRLRLKIIALLVIAICKLSKKYRLVLFKRNQEMQHFRKLKMPHLKFLQFFGQRQIKQQFQNFTENLFSKITSLLTSENYNKGLIEILKQKEEMILDFQQQQLCYFIKLLLQDLELITRKNVLPPFINHSLNLSLFRGKQTQTSQFVSNRTQFYSKTVVSLNSEQQGLIASEYLIFTIILPIILEIANKQVFTQSNRQMNFSFSFIALPILLTDFFTNHFKNLPKIQNPNVKPIQLILTVLEDQEIPLKTQLITSSILESDEELMISGNFKKQFVYSIFNEKPKYKFQMNQLFSKIIKNIETQIDIENAQFDL